MIRELCLKNDGGAGCRASPNANGENLNLHIRPSFLLPGREVTLEEVILLLGSESGAPGVVDGQKRHD